MASKPNRFKSLMQTIRQENGAIALEDANPSSAETADSEVLLPNELEILSELPGAEPIEQAPKSGILIVPLDKIHPDQNQDRRYFDETEIANMAASMQSVGVIDPLTVRRKAETTDEYDLLAGEKRWRSAVLAGLKVVPVHALEVDDRTAEDIKSISNLQRSDLNAWEETNAIMGLLERNLGKSQSEVISLLNQAANQKRGLTSNVVRSDEWEVIEEVFSIAGRLSPESFRKHRVPLLNLPDPIQKVLHQGKLHYTKVNEILKVKDPDQQEELLEEALRENLSVEELKARVKELKPGSSASTHTVLYRLAAITRVVKRRKLWRDAAKQKRLDDLLSKLEDLIQDD